MNEAAELREKLAEIGSLPDAEVPLAETALLLSQLRYPGRNADRYRQHIRRLCEDVSARYQALLCAGADEDASTRLAALKHILADQYGYNGVSENYENIENADLITAIEKRKGLPIVLAILTLEAGRAQGWNVEGINFPGHFLVRMEEGAERIIFDPFHGFPVLQAPDLRALLKKIAGPSAELSAKMYEPAGNREVLLRLQNNIKLRQIEAEDYQGALATVEDMRLLAPQDTRLMLDAGVLYSRTGQRQAAIDILERYIREISDPQDRYDAEVLLRHLRESLH